MSPLNQGGDDLDSNYVLSSRVRTGRSIRGFCLPPHCSRGERRAVEKLSIEGRNTMDPGTEENKGPLTDGIFPLYVILMHTGESAALLMKGAV